MSTPVTESPARQMQIGLVAYGIDGPNPSLVFVRVPTERGRWLLTDRCVVEVACDMCGATVGEPCRRGFRNSRTLKHGAGTHAWRRDAWQLIKRTRPWRDTPKLRMPASDLENARGEP